MKRNSLILIATLLGIGAGATFYQCGDKSKVDDNKVDVTNTVCPPPTDVMVPPEPITYVDTASTVGLKIYYPDFTRIDLACGERPSKEDKEVIMMAAAAFTNKLLDKFEHTNVGGDHVSGGKYYSSGKAKRCTGTFTYHSGKPQFFYLDEGGALKDAAANGGCGFVQEMMIHADTVVPHTRPDDNVNEFRALCLVDGRLAVIDSNGARKFGDFIASLQHYGVSEALYMDMGPGWNYSWYRDDDGSVKEIHKIPSSYSTNWLTFYRDSQAQH